jgi:HEAT repeat protein
LKSDKTLDKDAALSALGRFGNAACVAPIFAAIKDAHNPTHANGIAALRKLQGEDVTHAIVAAYPDLPPELQLEIIPVLGDKKHAMVVPILKDAAGSKDAEFRTAALTALGEAGQADGLDPLATAAKSSNEMKNSLQRKVYFCWLIRSRPMEKSKRRAKLTWSRWRQLQM